MKKSPYPRNIDAIIKKAAEQAVEDFVKRQSGQTTASPKEEDFSHLLKIGQLAKETSTTIPTIRFWTKEGLLNVAHTTAGGYALYSPFMVERVKMIRKLQTEKRLTIAELKGLFGKG